jgi:hypothetical protein
MNITNVKTGGHGVSHAVPLYWYAGAVADHSSQQWHLFFFYFCGLFSDTLIVSAVKRRRQASDCLNKTWVE